MQTPNIALRIKSYIATISQLLENPVHVYLNRLNLARKGEFWQTKSICLKLIQGVKNIPLKHLTTIVYCSILLTQFYDVSFNFILDYLY